MDKSHIDGLATLEARFWNQMDRGSDCWHWMMCRTDDGYGRSYCQYGGRKKTLGAHRLAYVLANGSLQDGAPLLHSCGNPICCNPAHLRVGTPKENADDREAMGRTFRGAKHHFHLHPELTQPGEPHNTAKLREHQVRAIRAEHAAGSSYAAISRHYHMHETTIADLVKRKTWKNVN